jgi:hypothetical protein
VTDAPPNCHSKLTPCNSVQHTCTRQPQTNPWLLPYEDRPDSVMRLLTVYKLALALASLSIIHKTAAWECSATSNVTMINLKDAPDHRHLQILARGFKSPYATVWPRRISTRVPNGIVRTVKYCYANTAVYSAVNYQMQSAMATWSIAVGTDN